MSWITEKLNYQKEVEKNITLNLANKRETNETSRKTGKSFINNIN